MVILQSGVGRNASKSLPSPARGSPSLQSLPNTTPVEFQGMEQMIQRWRNLEAQKIQRLNQAEPYVKMREQKEYDELRRRFLETKQRGKAEIKEQRITNTSHKPIAPALNSRASPSSSSISTLTSPHSTFSLNTSASNVSSSSSNEEPNGAKRKAQNESWPAFNVQTDERAETSREEFRPSKRRPKYSEPVSFHSEPSYATNNHVQNSVPVNNTNNYPAAPANASMSTDNNLTVNCSPNDLLNLSDIPDVWGDLVLANSAQVVDDSLISASLKDVFGVPPSLNYSFPNAPTCTNYSSSNGTAVVNNHQQQHQYQQQQNYVQNFNNFRPSPVQQMTNQNMFLGAESSQTCLPNVPQQGSFQASKQLERMAAQSGRFPGCTSAGRNDACPVPVQNIRYSEYTPAGRTPLPIPNGTCMPANRVGMWNESAMVVTAQPNFSVHPGMANSTSMVHHMNVSQGPQTKISAQQTAQPQMIAVKMEDKQRPVDMSRTDPQMFQSFLALKQSSSTNQRQIMKSNGIAVDNPQAQSFMSNMPSGVDLSSMAGGNFYPSGYGQQPSAVIHGTAGSMNRMPSNYGNGSNFAHTSPIQINPPNDRSGVYYHNPVANYVPNQEYDYSSGSQQQMTPNAVGHRHIANGQQQQNSAVFGSDFYSARR